MSEYFYLNLKCEWIKSYETESRGRIFSSVQLFYEWAVSNLDP